MTFRIGHTEWPSFRAWLKEVIFCIALRRHDWDDWPACRRCGVVKEPLSES